MVQRRQPDALEQQPALVECVGELTRVPLELVGITLAIGKHRLGPGKLKVADRTEIVFLATFKVNITASRAEDDWLEIVRSADAEG